MTPDAQILTVALYAGLNALIFLWLTGHVGRMRWRRRVLIGDGGDALMLRAMRGQANFVENVPLALILMTLMAWMATPVWVLHLFGVALTLGRLLHAMHFTAEQAPLWSRTAGAVLTLAVLGMAGLGTIGHVLWQMVAA